jgi:hypothetical protein
MVEIGMCMGVAGGCGAYLLLSLGRLTGMLWQCGDPACIGGAAVALGAVGWSVNFLRSWGTL